MENREKRRAYERTWRKDNPEKIRAYHAKWAKANPEKRCAESARRFAKPESKERIRATSREYGRRRQGLPAPTRPAPSVCEKCNKPSARALCLDHDHETRKFRGWLCYVCNAAIGMLGDDLAGVMDAARYLERAGETE